MITGIDPKVDYAFKRLFGSEANLALLLDMLQAVLRLPPDRGILSLELRNPFTEKETQDSKLAILDIKARDQRGTQYNIEMQMMATRIFPNRVLYYWAKVHGDQLHEGEKYQLLQPTISICFVNSVLFPAVPDHHLEFKLRNSKHPQLVFSEHQWMHLVELPKFKKTVDQLKDALDRWCYFFAHGDELDPDKLPLALQNPTMEQAVEVLKMIKQTDLERYEARLKAQRDAVSFAEEARDEGLEEGIELGIDLGQIIGRIHLCQDLLKQPSTPTAELRSLPMDALQDLFERLKRTLGKESATDAGGISDDPN
jgi:predicted transposase/invertase (TIGR01784 family)